MSDADSPRPGASGPWRTALRVLGWVVLAAFVGMIVFAGLWRLQGGRIERVQTASMGTVAPVGSLLWVKPVDFASLEPGDFITFRPPGRGGTTYSHRVLTRNDNGTLSTKGQITAPDPWQIGAGDVIGQVRMNWFGVGWLVQAAPVLVVGALLIGLARTLLRPDWRLPATLVLASLVVTAALVVYHPLLGAQHLATAPLPGGGVRVSYVGTGLLPIEIAPSKGVSAVIGPGEIGNVTLRSQDASGRLAVSLHPAVGWWWWVGLVGICFVPAVWSFVRDRRERRTRRATTTPLACMP